MSPQLHPFDVICTVLRSWLRGDDADSRFLAALRCSALDERSWVSIASRHRIVPALSACLHHLGLMSLLPEDLRIYLSAMRASNATQNQAFTNELRDIVTRLNASGIEPCVIKGSARLIDGIYSDASWRFMTDLDLLVPGASLRHSASVLEGIGYSTFHDLAPMPHHYPALSHPERRAVVELHHQLGTMRCQALLPVDEILSRARSVESQVGRVLLLDPQDQVTLLIAHAQILHGYTFYGITRLCDLLELDRLATTYQLDWPVIIENFDRQRWRPACVSFLTLGSYFLHTPMPIQLPSELATKLYTKRCIYQQYYHALMFVSVYLGWFAHRVYRTSVELDRRSNLHRVKANFGPRAKTRFPGLRNVVKEFL